MIIQPPYLKKGDTIGILCPAGYMPYEKAQTCIETLEKWGFKVKVGKTLGNQFHYFSGTDAERLNDLQTMLDDDSIKAVLCARGGYGLSRIIDDIDFSAFIKNPKWIIGYSDVTVLHAQLLACCNISSLHAPMAAAFNNGEVDNVFVRSVFETITGKNYHYSCAPHPLNRAGTATAAITGGNLSILTHLTGSPSEMDFTNKILFLEDIGEYIYNIDRMMVHLKRAGKLQHLAGLIIGKFTETKDTTIPFGTGVYELIAGHVKAFSFPVCYNFPVSHSNENYVLKMGVEHTLSVTESSVSLKVC